MRFTENDKQFIGEAIDIDNDGFLIVRDENNDVRRLISADIDIKANDMKIRRVSYGTHKLCSCRSRDNWQSTDYDEIIQIGITFVVTIKYLGLIIL